MSPTFALYKKEVRGFLYSPSFLVVCALIATVLTWVYPILLQQFQMAAQNSVYSPNSPPEALNIHYGLFTRVLSWMNLFLMFLAPALAMKLFSEEMKLKTFDLLLTAPIKSWQIVLGKYAAALTAIFFVMLISFLYPAATSLFASFSWTTLTVAYFGMFLVGCVYAAISLFCSSLTQSSIAAYFMAIILNVIIWLFGMSVELVDGAGARAVLEHLSLNTHLASLLHGTLRSSSLIFFASVIFLFCFLCERVVESSRWR